MLEEHLKWREEFEGGMDKVMDASHHSEHFLQLMNYWPGELHGVDKDGN
jgi:hypothetical protein